MISLYLRLLSRFSVPSPLLSLFPIYLCPLSVYHVVSVFAHTSIIFYLLLFASSPFASSYLLAPPSHDEGFAGALLCAVTFPLALPAVINLQNRITSPPLSLPSSRIRASAEYGLFR